jgi:hypothetical protein
MRGEVPESAHVRADAAADRRGSTRPPAGRRPG